MAPDDFTEAMKRLHATQLTMHAHEDKARRGWDVGVTFMADGEKHEAWEFVSERTLRSVGTRDQADLVHEIRNRLLGQAIDKAQSQRRA